MMRTCSADDCNRPHYARGLCHLHYQRDRRAGDRVLLPSRYAYFLAHVHDDTDECLMLPISKSGDGYVDAWIKGKRQSLHVLACEIAHGPRPPGMEVGHGPCHNKACWNPRHVRWVTRSQNAQDKHRDGTALVGDRNPMRLHPEHSAFLLPFQRLRGESHHQAKLTAAQVAAIRSRYTGARGELTALGEEYGVSRVQIKRIVSNVSWNQS